MSTTQEQELRKPTFVKVKDLEKTRSGYNVYVKVISTEPKEVETRDGQKIKMIDAVVGD
jgi:ssDNA-binding replication factor A large subunit